MSSNIAEAIFFPFPSILTWGASNEADFIAVETNSIIRELQSTISIGLGKEDIFNKLLGIAEECATDGWDGEKAKPVIDVTLQKATSFLKVMPLGTESPTIAVEPDGSISFEWYRSPRKVLSVSVGSDCFLHYAALIDERKAYGTEPFLGAVPDVIMDLISQVTHS